MADWIQRIRDIPDFPKPGIVFKDIMPMLADPLANAAAIDALAAPWRDIAIDAVMAIEARGFLTARRWRANSAPGWCRSASRASCRAA